LHKSCYGCYFEVNEKCNWFYVHQNLAPKPIPIDKMDNGCSKYKNTEMSGLGQHHHIIELFDGEILSDKYERPTYKKKWTKSPHKYTHRRDAQ